MQSRKHTFPVVVASLITCFLTVISCDLKMGTPIVSALPGVDLSAMTTERISHFLKNNRPEDAIAAAWFDEDKKQYVRDFFTTLTGSESVADAILDSATRHGVPVDLAFALAFEESDFNPRAFSKNAGSVDRGLFQLNSRSFPDIPAEDAFKPDINADHALSYLADCLEKAGNDVAALAMYNAGHTRVKAKGIAQPTLDYIGRVFACRENIVKLYGERVTESHRFLESFSLAVTSY